jgi:hypothetical protein
MSEEAQFIWKFNSEGAATRGRDGVTTWTLTSGAVDRDGERVFSPGVDCTEFDQNPVALASHNRGTSLLPIGRWENRRLVGSGWDARILADLRPAPAGVSAAADEANGLVAAGMLRACSVGFLSVERARGPDGTLDHMRSVLIECSVCAIGANPEALRVAAYRGGSPLIEVYAEPTYTIDPEMAVRAMKAAVDRVVLEEIAKAKGYFDVEGMRAQERKRKAQRQTSSDIVERLLAAASEAPPAEPAVLAAPLDFKTYTRPAPPTLAPTLEIPARFLR